MPAERFLDTNIIVYAFDETAPSKMEKARSLMGRDDWSCSWQVIQEFASVALHRFRAPMKPEDLKEYLDLVMWPRCAAFPSRDITAAALEIHRTSQFRFYDSLIVASAIAAGAARLLSEDLQAGRSFGDVTIENPFV